MLDKTKLIFWIGVNKVISTAFILTLLLGVAILLIEGFDFQIGLLFFGVFNVIVSVLRIVSSYSHTIWWCNQVSEILTNKGFQLVRVKGHAYFEIQYQKVTVSFRAGTDNKVQLSTLSHFKDKDIVLDNSFPPIHYEDGDALRELALNIEPHIEKFISWMPTRVSNSEE